MLSFIGSLLFLFFVAIVVVRFMGKTALAQFTPHDFTAIFFIIAIAMNPIEVNTIGKALTGIVLIIVLHLSFSRLSLYNSLNRFIVGEPTILIKHGKLDRANLKKSRFSLAELLSSVRSQGYADISNIQYAILEPNGAISVLPKEEAMPVTAKMMELEPEYQGFPMAVIIEGDIQYENLRLIHKDKTWLEEAMKETGFSNVRDVFYASVKDTNRSLVVDDGQGTIRTL
ncbi:DUF421 domain-containing protein [Salibacterium aidingense]|uniref:DUF421 domain-containing protein n=1 Tax=Salibacterium aidingense TaxID=384933 RepID=UPI003BC03DD5